MNPQTRQSPVRRRRRAKAEHASTEKPAEHGFNPLEPSFGLMFWSVLTFVLLSSC